MVVFVWPADPRSWAEDGPEVIRGPYLQSNTPHSVVLRWKTDIPTATWLAYGPQPDQLDSTVSDPAVLFDHEVLVDGLTAATDYYYAVGADSVVLAGGNEQFFIRSAPVAGAAAATWIWALGDSGTAKIGARRVRDAYLSFAGSGATDVWLMMGDNAYPSGTAEEYQAAVFDTYSEVLINTPLWPAIGNHDILSSDSPTQTGPFFDFFTLPDDAQAGGAASGTEAYYSFDHGPVHFICLDTADSSMAEDGAMMSWLRQDLAPNRGGWVIAFFHHPPYSKGQHDSDDPADSSGLMFDVRQIVVPILEEYGVDLVLAGHSHSYERSILLDGHYGTSVTFDPGTMGLDVGDGREDGDGPYRKVAGAHGGAVFVVTGNGSNLGGGTFDHPVMVVSLRILGSVALAIDGDKLDAWMIDADGQILDWFTIIKTQTLFADGFEDGSTSAWI